MIIISHRGYWKASQEKNTLLAFNRSFEMGCGVETDIRDFNGKLVISHDIATENSLSVEDFFRSYQRFSNNRSLLALNVKADGLQLEIKKYLEEYQIDNYFFFDMSIPDMMGYLKQQLTTFARWSEFEPETPLFKRVQGVWLDSFSKTIVDEKLIQNFIDSGKKVCLVSPELHARPYADVWKAYKAFSASTLDSEQLILCTDFPEQAKRFFCEQEEVAFS